MFDMTCEKNLLPQELQLLIDQVHAMAADYAGRAGDVSSLADWIAKGDHSQAEFKARQIIARQQNVRGPIEARLTREDKI